jgi:hypothetical protein
MPRTKYGINSLYPELVIRSMLGAASYFRKEICKDYAKITEDSKSFREIMTASPSPSNHFDPTLVSPSSAHILSAGH